jgi:hypothetical protein
MLKLLQFTSHIYFKANFPPSTNNIAHMVQFLSSFLERGAIIHHNGIKDKIQCTTLLQEQVPKRRVHGLNGKSSVKTVK